MAELRNGQIVQQLGDAGGAVHSAGANPAQSAAAGRVEVAEGVGARNSGTSRDLLILVEQSAEPVVRRTVLISVLLPSGSGRRGAAWPRVRCGR